MTRVDCAMKVHKCGYPFAILFLLIIHSIYCIIWMILYWLCCYTILVSTTSARKVDWVVSGGVFVAGGGGGVGGRSFRAGGCT